MADRVNLTAVETRSVAVNGDTWVKGTERDAMVEALRIAREALDDYASGTNVAQEALARMDALVDFDPPEVSQ